MISLGDRPTTVAEVTARGGLLGLGLGTALGGTDTALRGTETELGGTETGS